MVQFRIRSKTHYVRGSGTMELVIARIIADMKTGYADKRVREYLLEDYQGEQYNQIIKRINSIMEMPFEQIFNDVPGYLDLTPESKKSFMGTIVPFLQCQGKGRLVTTSIDHIEDRNEPEGIRVYLKECGDKCTVTGYQYFNNGEWG